MGKPLIVYNNVPTLNISSRFKDCYIRGMRFQSVHLQVKYSVLCNIEAVLHNLYSKQKHLGCKKVEANQKQHASRQVRPKALISVKTKKLTH